MEAAGRSRPSAHLECSRTGERVDADRVAGTSAAGGTAIAVSDEQLLAAQRTLTELVVLDTGAGIKYPETVELDVPLLGKTEPIPTSR